MSCGEYENMILLMTSRSVRRCATDTSVSTWNF